MKTIATILLFLSGTIGTANIAASEPPSPLEGEIGGYSLQLEDAVREEKTLVSETIRAVSAKLYGIPLDPKKRCPRWEPLFEAANLQPVDVFSYIAWRESGCKPSAQNATWDSAGNMTYALNKNGTYDTGLLQINSSWYTVTKQVCGENAVKNYMSGLKSPECNVAVAKYIMDNSKGKLGNWRVFKTN
jgi:hypothetical protein